MYLHQQNGVKSFLKSIFQFLPFMKYFFNFHKYILLKDFWRKRHVCKRKDDSIKYFNQLCFDLFSCNNLTPYQGGEATCIDNFSKPVQKLWILNMRLESLKVNFSSFVIGKKSDQCCEDSRQFPNTMKTRNIPFGEFHSKFFFCINYFDLFPDHRLLQNRF